MSAARLIEGTRKLRGRSFDELRERAAQFVASRAERSALFRPSYPLAGEALRRELDRTVAGDGRPESLLERFRSRREPRFFRAFDDPAATTAALRSATAASIPSIIETADRLIDGRFDLLGHRDVSFGTPPAWSYDPFLRRHAPAVHWSQIAFLDPAVVGDHKLVWELNRHQYLSVLGRAYWLTADERYAATFAAHLASWMAENPPKTGVNWASSLEVAFRAIAWTWALHFFRHSPSLTSALYERMLGMLWIHGRHIERYLSTYFSPNTHLTGEALGLVYLGTMFPELRRARHWRSLGARILEQQLDQHVRADGVYFEQATYYHRYTVDFYTHFVLLAEVNGASVRERVEPKLTALLDHLMFITRPDGRTPLIGDDDGGRLAVLDVRQPNDFRAALSTGAVLFGRGDYAHVAGGLSEETIWLLGPSAVAAFGALRRAAPAERSRGFAAGGYYVMRDGWASQSQYAVIDCGPHGVMNCGHAHADALSIELAADGRSWLVDPGTYTYTTSREARDAFRHAASHNTVTVDGASSSEPGGPFAWAHVATARACAWRTHDMFDYFDGEHDGYERLTAPVSCRRSVLYLKGRYWVMRDRVESMTPHTTALHFHAAAGVDVRRTAPNEVTLIADSPSASLRIHVAPASPGAGAPGDGARGAFTVGDGWVSSAYGVRTGAAVCTYTLAPVDRADVVTLLLPSGAVPDEALVLHAVRGGEQSIVLESPRAFDLLLIGGRLAVAHEGIAADAEWAWVRRSGAREAVVEFVLVDGRALTVDGETVVDLERRAAFVVGRRVGERWQLEVDGRTKAGQAESPPSLQPALAR